MTEFSWRTRVYWEDTDGGGVVYYANYLKFMERARTEWLRSLGHSQAELAEQHGFVFTVVEVKVNYRKPARLDDELLVSCVPVPEGRVACVDSKTFRPRALPEFVQVNDGK
jgi:acyl-CoA thioester hydrolase